MKNKRPTITIIKNKITLNKITNTNNNIPIIITKIS